MARRTKGFLASAALLVLGCGGAEAPVTPDARGAVEQASGKYYTATILDMHLYHTTCPDSLPVYSEPSLASPVLCTLYKDDGVMIAELSADEQWVYVTTQNTASCGTRLGWIQNGYFCKR